MNPTKTMLQRVRVLHATFVVTQFLFVFVVKIAQPVAQAVHSAIVIALGVVALTNCGFALFFRDWKVKTSEEKLRTQPDDPGVLREWFSGNVISFAFAESCGLFGVVLKLLGADWKVAGPFFGLAVVVMLLLTPRLDVPQVA
jgi:hypothetical protein